MLYSTKNADILDKNIYRMVKAFLHHGHLLKELNNTHITLIQERKTWQELMIIDLLAFVMFRMNLETFG